jgi:pimeloyl-ACP methyl ester carboxylesterase
MTSARAASSVVWNERPVSVCGGELRLAVAGSGPPIVVLPRDQGHPPVTQFLDQLAATGTGYYPWLAGFHGGHPEQWEWLMNVRDLAIVHRQMIDALGLDRPALVGLGFGGWVAAEIATMESSSLRAVALVSPMGVKPQSGYIFDQFIVSTEHYAQTAFYDQRIFAEIYGPETSFEQLEAWETDREMTSRLAWKPSMYNPTLPRLLAGVNTPAFVVWGEEDQIVPLECGEMYRSALPRATLELVPNCGHAVELEQPEKLAELAGRFLAGQ